MKDKFLLPNHGCNTKDGRLETKQPYAFQVELLVGDALAGALAQHDTVSDAGVVMAGVTRWSPVPLKPSALPMIPVCQSGVAELTVASLL